MLVAGELTISKLRSPKRSGIVGWTIPFMLFGHPLFWGMIGLGGLLHLIPGTHWYGAVDLPFASICAFTGLSLVWYMAFRFMPRTDQLLKF